MISYLVGKPMQIGQDQLAVLVGGVGYEVWSSGNSLASFEGREAVEVFVHTVVREDAIQLYGFASMQEKQIFLSLLKVNGIGPKLALNILSGTSVDQLVQMIEAGDAQRLSKLPKIGKKTAEQMILTLQGKLVRVDGNPSLKTELRNQLVSALVNLGFRLQEVEPTVDRLGAISDLESGVRKALAALSSGEMINSTN